MAYIQLFPVLLLLAYPIYIRGNDGQCRDLKSEIVRSLTTGNEKIMSMVSGLTNLVKSQTEIIKAQGETIQELEQDMKYLRQNLDERLRENELKVEWALTDGTLAPKNTSGIMKNLVRQEEKIDRSLDMLTEIHDFTTAGGGWSVIQKRFDGSVDFYRGWEEYAEGFGDLAGEHWLGLRHIHALTKEQPMELYVSLTDFDLGLRYAKYTPFSVSSEEDKFRLFIGAYSGNAGDSLTYHNGSMFSTKDQDNDSTSSHCARSWHGAWWYKRCHHANLNGLFSPVKVDGFSYINWRYLQTKKRAMKASLMMIRPLNFNP